MAINNVNLNSKIDTALNTHLDEFQKTAQPQPQQQTRDIPIGLAGRVSVEGALPPRQNLGAMLGGSVGGTVSFGGSGAPGVPGMPGGPGLPLSTADVSHQGAQLSADATNLAANDGGDAMQSVIKANMMSMQFQSTMAVVQMQVKMNEAVAKGIKSIGTAVSQLAS